MTGRLVWLSSFPKSGNTWVRALLTAVTLRPEDRFDLNALLGTKPLLDIDLFEDVIGLCWNELRTTEQLALLPRFTADLAQNAHGLEVRKTHMRFGHTPTGEPIFSNAAGAVALHVVRDPRQVAVSHARFFGTDIDTSIARMNDPDRLVPHGREFMTENTGSWGEHVLGWVRQDHLPVQLVKYEDLLSNPHDTVAKMVSFVGLNVGPKQIESACARAQFGQLQAMEADTGFSGRSRTNVPFFRKGTGDEWRDILTSDQRRRIERDHACAMEYLCYT